MSPHVRPPPPSFRYLLRCAIQPGFHEAARTSALMAFCRAARIDDVMFFVNCEEINQGHLTLAQTQTWLDLVARIQPRLTARGITTSLNPWQTILHADRGRTLQRGQRFDLMVDANGRRAEAQVCPLGIAWRRYLAATFAQYASIRPNTIWVEDDFRFHNHAPLEWGGCFCDAHLRAFSKRLGRRVTRRTFFRNLVRPGTPHSDRAAWLPCCRQTMNGLAKLIGNAVVRTSPQTRVALMSSIPSVHCAENRDWHTLLRNLAAGRAPIVRAHLPAYPEVPPGQYLWDFAGVTLHTQASVPADTILYPELDSFAVCNSRFSKSHRFSRFQILLAAITGSHGITLNIFDMMGNGPVLQEGIQRMLADSKPFLDDMASLGLRTADLRGVVVPVCPEASRSIHTRDGRSMTELYPVENFWARFLSCHGIANTLTTATGQRGELLAVSGQYFRNLPRREIARLLAENHVFLDGEAVMTLIDLGLGRLIGARAGRWMPVDTGLTAYEQVRDGRVYAGVTAPRISSQTSAGDAVAVTYSRPPDEHLSDLCDAFGRVVAPGVTVCGRTIIFPYGRIASMPFSQLTPVRQEMLQELVRRHAPTPRPAFHTFDAPYLPIFAYRQRRRTVLTFANSAMDDLPRLRFVSTRPLPLRAVAIESATGRRRTARLQRQGDIYTLERPLPALEVLALVFDASVATKGIL